MAFESLIERHRLDVADQQRQRVARASCRRSGPMKFTWIGYDADSPPPIGVRMTIVGL